MKKNISINISGIIFHIEEDAFDKLKAYLDGINRYFSTFDDSQEIIADIESRIAEIFLSKLTEEKQVITFDDVETLITTMGNISDFQAAEDSEINEDNSYKSHRQSTSSSTTSSTSKKLFRDEKRKLLGGVCSGIAHYFNIDPLWIRLLFILLLFGSFGSILLVYFVMWAVVPGSSDLPEDRHLKKMFRDSENKVLAGVSAGLANYFGIDVVVIRVLFVLSCFIGGAGFITYIALWIILPEAKSFSEKVQMKGDPITLTNIESNVKQSLNIKEDEEENVFVKILLFPFRLIATIIDTLGKAIGPIALLFVDLIRIIIGAAFVMLGITGTLGLVVALGLMIGIFSSDFASISNFGIGNIGLPFDTMTDGIPGFTLAAAFFLATIPLFFMTLLGASIIAKRVVFSANTGWVLFAGFVISIVILAANVPSIVLNFKEEGDFKTIEKFDSAQKTTILKLNNSGMGEYHVVNLELRGYEGDVLKLEKVFEAQGRTNRDAEENAKMIQYDVVLEDSLLYFDSNISFKDDAVFRAQRLEMKLYIPYGAKFMMDEDLRKILRNTIYRSGYRVSDMEDNVWTFTKSGLNCLTCEYEVEEDEKIISDKTFSKNISFDPFEEIEIKGAFTINIENSESFKVLVDGNDQDTKDMIIRQDGDRIYIGMRNFKDIGDLDISRKDIEITILTPTISYIELVGANKAYISNFDLDDLKIDLMGASFLKADIIANDLDIELTGASELDIRGKGNELNAHVTGASHLDAYSFRVDNATLEASGVSSIKAFVTNHVFMDENFISNIKVRGGANVNSDKNEL